MIDLKTLKQLIRLMVDNELTEVDLEDGGEKVKLRRSGQGPEVQYVPAPAPAAAAPPAPVPAAGAPASSPADEGLLTIESPMVGTFYAASTPDAKAFVAVGDTVDDDTVVCIIEAMKVFNEIKAEVSGTVERVLVDNGQAVEFGQPLFKIKPN